MENCRDCGSLKWRCDDGTCIGEYLLCDSFANCKDGTDEVEACPCQERCSLDPNICIKGDSGGDAITGWKSRGRCRDCANGHFRCNNGRCINPAVVCDGHNDCGHFPDVECSGNKTCVDTADEDRCVECRTTGASKVVFTLPTVCAQKPAFCSLGPKFYDVCLENFQCEAGNSEESVFIEEYKVCDSNADCENGSDETISDRFNATDSGGRACFSCLGSPQRIPTFKVWIQHQFQLQ